MKEYGPAIFLVTIIFLFHIQLSLLSEAQDTGIYKGNDFSVRYPESFNVSTSGSPTSGDLKLANACQRILLNWTWDPGISPDEILDGLKGIYEGTDIKVLSSESGEIRIQGQEIKTLNLTYEFKGQQAEKEFAIWNSSRSNRLFLASLSSCNKNQGTEVFNSILASFNDLGNGELIRPKLNNDETAWSVVLRDLLSSYHYRDLSILPATVVNFQEQSSLLQYGGKYHPDSTVTIHVNPPLSALGRAATVQRLLLEEGDQVRLFQKGKDIGLALLDPSGKWQLVSINPLEPGRSIGVLLDNIYEATTYKSPEDFPFYRVSGLEDLKPDKVIESDTEPSRYVELQKPSNISQTWLGNLENVLGEYEYGKTYQENVFDCSNTTQIAWSILTNKGFDARLMMSYKGHPLDPHIWVVVKYPYEPERYLAIETANTNQAKILEHLGRIVQDEKYYEGIMYNTSIQYSRLHPNEGMWLAVVK